MSHKEAQLEGPDVHCTRQGTGTAPAPAAAPAPPRSLKLASAEPQGLTSFALSLLLVFRTNSSYGRFDEARKIWGGILNRARNIANQVRGGPSPGAARGGLPGL